MTSMKEKEQDSTSSQAREAFAGNELVRLCTTF